jgi:biopolymer transport protein ExbB
MRLRFLSSVWGASVCSLTLLALALGVCSALNAFTAAAVYGQADKLSDDKLAEQATPKADAQGNSTAGVPTSRSKSWLRWLYESLGPMYSVIFLLLSFTLVSVMVMNILAVRRSSIVPEQLAQGFEALVEEKKYQEAYELVKADESMLGRVLAAGMSKVSAGYDEAAKSMQEAGEEETMRLEHRLSYISLIAQIGPLFGLLGTVDGMVQAFDVIAASNTTPKPNQLAQGIGTALVTTVVGLWIAIPSIAFNHVVRGRLATFLHDTATVTENLMGRFAAMGKK